MEIKVKTEEVHITRFRREFELQGWDKAGHRAVSKYFDEQKSGARRCLSRPSTVRQPITRR